MRVAVVLHTIMVILALLLGIFITVMPKGTPRHRFLGYLFIFCMGLGTMSSFWIHTFGWFSPIHILSIMTLYWLTAGIISTRQKKKGWVYRHALHMGSAFIGILIAGAGVIVRHFIAPGNVVLGGIASVIVACFAVPLLLKAIKKYKINS